MRTIVYGIFNLNKSVSSSSHKKVFPLPFCSQKEYLIGKKGLAKKRWALILVGSKMVGKNKCQ